MKILAACLVVIAFPVFAETGNELITKCKDNSAGILDGFCLGYIHGALEAQFTEHLNNYFNINSPGHKPEHIKQPYCLPDGSIGQYRQVFLKWAAAHPEKTYLPADMLIGFSLREAFPCAK